MASKKYWLTFGDTDNRQGNGAEQTKVYLGSYQAANTDPLNRVSRMKAAAFKFSNTIQSEPVCTDNDVQNYYFNGGN